MKSLPTVYELIATNPVSLGRLTGVLRDMPWIATWCQLASRGIDLPLLASTLIKQFPQLLGISIEDYILKRWSANLGQGLHPAIIELELRPKLELIEMGAVSLVVPIVVHIELRAVEGVHQVSVIQNRIVFPVGARWKASAKLGIGTASPVLFHEVPWQLIAMPSALLV